MSRRSLIEVNHNASPADVILIDWATRLRAYVRSGDPAHLPEGMSLMPCPTDQAHLLRDLWSVLQGCREDLRRMAEAHPPGRQSVRYGRALATLETRLAGAIEAVEMELNDPAGSG